MAVPYSSTANLPFGSRSLTINSVAYIAENWAPQKAARKISRPDANGDEAAFMLRADPTSQSGLRLQLATTSTATPALGEEFTVDNVVYVISGVSKSESVGAYHSCDVSYQSKVLPTS